jgi:hypothetical protein
MNKEHQFQRTRSRSKAVAASEQRAGRHFSACFQGSTCRGSLRSLHQCWQLKPNRRSERRGQLCPGALRLKRISGFWYLLLRSRSQPGSRNQLWQDELMPFARTTALTDHAEPDTGGEIDDHNAIPERRITDDACSANRPFREAGGRLRVREDIDFPQRDLTKLQG